MMRSNHVKFLKNTGYKLGSCTSDDYGITQSERKRNALFAGKTQNDGIVGKNLKIRNLTLQLAVGFSGH